MKIRKFTTLACIAALFAALILGGCSDDLNDDGNNNPAPYNPPATKAPPLLEGKLLILQAYGSGDHAAPAGSHSFVELYNVTDSSIDLTGVVLWFADGTRVAAAGDPPAEKDTDWESIALSGSIPAKGSYLIRGLQSNAASPRLQVVNGDKNDDSLALGNRSFKVALIQGSTQLTDGIQNPFNPKVTGYIDMVGAANNPTDARPDLILGYEGPADNPSFPRISAQEAVRRTSPIDTNNNADDFESIRYAPTSDNGISDELFELRRPRNATETAEGWRPFAEPDDDEDDDPTLPGEQDEFAGQLLIFQAYGGNNANGVTHHFVELYNKGPTDIELDGYSLQYAAASANASGAEGDWKVIPLTDSIPAGHSYLILGLKNPVQTQRIQIADDAGDIIDNNFVLSNNGFKLALIHSTEKLTVANPFRINEDGDKAAGYVDMVGASNSFGTNIITGYEGSAPLTALPRNSAQEGIRRINLTDTNVNTDDFASVRYTTVRTQQYPHGVDDFEIEFYTPKNVAAGAWDPLDLPEDPGEPGDPGDDPDDPIVAGTADELAGQLLILQAYGSSSSAAGVSHSFVELYNTTNAEINLNGISLYYADGTDTGSGTTNTNTTDGAWKRISLDGKKIPAEGSFLILGPKQSPTAARYQIPDNSGDINHATFNLSNRAFKVALIRSEKALLAQNPFDMGSGAKADGYIDMVGAANDIAGRDSINGFETAPARNSGSEAVRRNSLTDSDNNRGISTDFPNATGDFDSLRYGSGTGTISNELLVVRRPRNSTETADGWDPFAEPEEPSTPPPETEKLMILQANTYGNDNGGGGGFPSSLVELYNNTNAAINLNGYYLHIGTNNAWTHLIALTGSISANSSFLVVSSIDHSTNGQRAYLPAADQYAAFAINNNNFKVALLRNRNSILAVDNPFTETSLSADYVDMLGVGTAACENQASSTSRPAGPRRTSLTDTNNNSTDFAVANYRGNNTSQGMPDNDLYKFWPRNSSQAWNPITGLPQVDPPALPPSPPSLSPPPATGELMILQANIRGNDNGRDQTPIAPTGGGFPRSLVELYNNTDADINLSNFSLHISKVDTWFTIVPLSGTIPAKSSFLIVSNSAASALSVNQTPRASLPTADLQADFIIGLDATGIDVGNSWKIALMINQNSLLTVANPFGDASLTANYVDMLGVGNNSSGITGFEGARTSGSAPQPPRRTSLTDTNNNNTDFAQADLRGRTGTRGIDDNQLYLYWPRNSSQSWNPITGLPQVDPTVVPVP